MKYELAFDNTIVVSESIREVLITLLEAIGLVVLVMFLFLQDWRSTIIPALTIPVSLVGTFAFVRLFGFSINTLTLFGITLATGLVVDDAIVVVENVQRHLHEYGKGRCESASDAMAEVVGPVIATALVLAAVFVPVALFPGHDRPALPAVRADDRLLGGHLGVQRADADAGALGAAAARRARAAGAFWRPINWVIDERHTRLRVGAAAVLVRRKALVIVAVPRGPRARRGSRGRSMPTGFVPDEDPGSFIVTVQGPSGASLGYTTDVTRQAEAILRAQPEINGVFTVNGFSFLGQRLQPGHDVRAAEAVRRAPGRSALGDGGHPAALRPVHGASAARVVVPFLPPPIQGIGRFGGFQFEVLDEAGGDIENLASATNALVAPGQPDARA